MEIKLTDVPLEEVMKEHLLNIADIIDNFIAMILL